MSLLQRACTNTVPNGTAGKASSCKAVQRVSVHALTTKELLWVHARLEQGPGGTPKGCVHQPPHGHAGQGACHEGRHL